MAKKFVRGITDVKTINNQDFDTNNVNDLLSDGQYNYIHRKKGKNEEYHNLTDNIKTLSSDNTELLSVTNNNKTTNTATLHPKHDAQKEQVLESTRDTITINHGTNGTAEKTTVDVNFEKVQEKLTAGDGLSLENNQINIKPTNVHTLPSKSGFYNGDFVDGEWANPYSAISLNIDGSKYIQLAFRQSVNTPDLIVAKYRFVVNDVPTAWKEMMLDSASITSLLSQKQDVLTAGTGITIQGNTISASAAAPVEGGAIDVTPLPLTTDEFDCLAYTVITSDYVMNTFVFECHSATAEIVLNSDLKKLLEPYFLANTSVSNGAITISNDGTNMKLINSAPSSDVHQQGTFTFWKFIGSGGVGPE